MFNTYLKRIALLTYQSNRKDITVVVIANLYENEEILHVKDIESQGFLGCKFGVLVNNDMERGVVKPKRLNYTTTLKNEWDYPSESDHITAVFLKHNGNLDSDSMNTEDGYEI